ncbi:PP2C family serine/threonine-protein phosphatase [Phytohabitans kaempferiae]|uniref:PP2C family serine/threonine-protein phosphatase n=1 Tax=Phytohabitans kaempferiae TaxID=1620943 RepID=A0ABV6LV65_9ACTN
MGTRAIAPTWFGASVRGPGHRHRRLPKQDAWRGTAGRFGSLVVVADGLGSRPHGGLGAVAACRAAHRAVRELAVTGVPDPADLFGRIEEHWRKEVEPLEPAECGTTVLLSLVHTSGGVLLGQVGDGLIAVETGATAEPLVQQRPGFGNETDALGSGRPPTWHSRWLLSPPAGFRVFMATDGVADDLRPDQVAGFVTELARQFVPLPPAERHRRLCAELRAWPTPGHFDDKTLALHWAERSDDACS